MTPLDGVWQSVLARPDDPGALRVLSDALIEQADPLGELIALSLSGVDDEHLRSWVARNVEALFGSELRLFLWNPRFENGFISQAGPFREREELDVFLSRPIARLVKRLEVELPVPELLATLTRKRATALKELTLRFARAFVPDEVLTVREVLAALPHLEVLLSFHEIVDLADASSDRLRALSLLVGGRCVGLGDARLPSLKILSMTLPFRRVDLDHAFLEGAATPGLKQLLLFGALWPSQLESLAGSRLLWGLERLDLLTSTDTGWYPVILQHADAFRHLAQFRIRPDGHHPEWIEAVRAVLPNVSVIDSTT